jgi:hypothetical protein
VGVGPGTGHDDREGDDRAVDEAAESLPLGRAADAGRSVTIYLAGHPLINSSDAASICHPSPLRRWRRWISTGLRAGVASTGRTARRKPSATGAFSRSFAVDRCRRVDQAVRPATPLRTSYPAFRSLEAATQNAVTPVSATSSRWDERRIRPDWTMCRARQPSPLPSDGSALRANAIARFTSMASSGRRDRLPRQTSVTPLSCERWKASHSWSNRPQVGLASSHRDDVDADRV